MSKSKKIYRDKCGCSFSKSTGLLTWICKEHYNNVLNWGKEPQHPHFVNISTWKKKKSKGLCAVRHCIELRFHHELGGYHHDVCKEHYFGLEA